MCFDQRIAVPVNSKNPSVIAHCIHCDEPCERYVNCANKDCNAQHFCCESCEEKSERYCCGECKEHMTARLEREAAAQ